MKRVLASVIAVMVLFCGLALAEEVNEEAQNRVEQSVAELTTSAEEVAYREYFESAYVVVKYTRNVAVNISNFFYIADAMYQTENIDYSFLKDLQSPLELTSSQVNALYKYKAACEENKNYKSYLESSLAAAVHFRSTLPAYLTVFSQLEKPNVPDKYVYVDSCLTNAVAEAQRFYDACIEYLEGKRTMPSYNDTNYEYLELINDVL